MKTAGCNEISHDIEENEGKITKFTVNQGIWKNGEGNRLRKQIYQVAFYDENMNVTRKHEIVTSETEATFEVEELIGADAAFAYHINYENFGYGKFRIDNKSMGVFQDSLHRIHDSLSRKQVYNMMYDMLKDNLISGAQVLQIVRSQAKSETDSGVLTDVLKFLIPVIIKNYMPTELYEKTHHTIFEFLLNIMQSGKINDKSTVDLILDSMLTSARNENHYSMIMNWFKQGYLNDFFGNKVKNGDISLEQRHIIVQRIYSSEKITLETKQDLLAQLETLDKSDRLSNTKKVCEATLPENKEHYWNLYFSQEAEIEAWGLYDYQNSMRGWNQVQQRQHTERLHDQFFDKITDIIARKGRYIAQSYWYLLRPMSESSIEKYETLLATVQETQPDNTFFLKMLKSTLGDLRINQVGRQASKDWLNAGNVTPVRVQEAAKEPVAEIQKE